MRTDLARPRHLVATPSSRPSAASPPPRGLFFALCAAAVTSAGSAASAQSARVFVRGDVNGDGVADVVRTGDDGARVYLAVPGMTSMRGVRWCEGAAGDVADAVEDLDGDGDAEVLVVSTRDLAGGRRVVRVTVCAGGHAPPARPMWSAEVGEVARAGLRVQRAVRSAGDLDGDGRPDMLAGETVFFARAAASDVAGRSVRSLMPPEARPATWDHAVIPLGDVDGRGVSTLWIAPLRRDSPPPQYPQVGLVGGAGLRLSSDHGRFTARPMPLFAGVTLGVHLVDLRPADVTGDGVDDLVGVVVIPALAVNSYQPGALRVAIAERVGAGNFQYLPWAAHEVRRPLSGPSSDGEPCLCAADTDGDGAAEIVFAGTRAPGTMRAPPPTRWRMERLTEPPTPHEAPDGVVAPRAFDCGRDFDGDGRADLVAVYDDQRAARVPW